MRAASRAQSRVSALVTPLFYVPAAVDANGFPGDEITLDDREHAFDDFRFATPHAERRRLFNVAKLIISDAGRREDRPWSNGVDENAICRELQRERLGQGNHAGLRDVVRQVAEVARPSALRRP